MKKVIFLIIICFSYGSMSISEANGFSNKDFPKETYVYVCNSTGATKYHYDKDCRGLNACKHVIIKVTKKEAYEKGKKTLCGWED